MGRIGELQEEVSRRKTHVTQMDHQIHSLNENISTLTKELELKGKEVLKIRSEANQQIRYGRAPLAGKETRSRIMQPRWSGAKHPASALLRAASCCCPLKGSPRSRGGSSQAVT